jgi:hypothetical protein
LPEGSRDARKIVTATFILVAAYAKKTGTRRRKDCFTPGCPHDGFFNLIPDLGRKNNKNKS